MRRVVVLTREAKKNKIAQKKLENASIPTISIPLIETTPLKVDEKMKFSNYDWLFFTSQNAVHYFFWQYKTCPATVKIAVIGTKTEEALIEKGFHADFLPSKFETDIFIHEWLEQVEGKPSILFPQSLKGRSVISDLLSQKGFIIKRLFLYDTVMPQNAPLALKKLFAEESYFYITFASPSAWKNFKKICEETAFNGHYQIVSIGPVTSDIIRRDGYHVAFQPEIYTMDALLDLLIKEFLKNEF